MEKKSLHETFEFLLSEGFFTDCLENHGPRYRQAEFHSPKIVLRIVEQDEITPQGVSVSCLAFLVDPENRHRWCMFEKAVEVMLGCKIGGSISLLELNRNLRDYIGSILKLSDHGSEPPFEDFSRFA